MGISLSFLNQLTPYSIILKRNKIILHQPSTPHTHPGCSGLPIVVVSISSRPWPTNKPWVSYLINSSCTTKESLIKRRKHMNYDSQIGFVLTIFWDMIWADCDVICPSDLVRTAFHISYLGIASTRSGDSSPRDCGQEFFNFFSNNA